MIVALAELSVGSIFFVLVVNEQLITTISPLAYKALIGGIAALSLLPSAFFGVSLLFTGQEIAVRDKGVLDSIRGSWELTRGVRGRLFLLAGVPAVIQIPLSFAVATALPELPANILTILESTVVSFIVLSIMARAYEQRVHATDGSFRTGPLSE
ncbi:hypothetical protein ACFQL1_06865 [Halomicroarcula sp. GCM10025709]|uniref:hypothetical protein n=1 Tax=Haloarcula TaxID=2237 RepID=UPI0024C225FB|nr:hypothetical protein [Halomicroarcula sp. YJ-61-S]